MGIVRIGVVQVVFGFLWWELLRVGSVPVGDAQVVICPGLHYVYIISTRKRSFSIESILRTKFESHKDFLEV